MLKGKKEETEHPAGDPHTGNAPTGAAPTGAAPDGGTAPDSKPLQA